MSKALRIPEREWEAHRDEIISRYLEQNSSLRETVEWMESKYGFLATENQYRLKLKAWKVRKHTNAVDWPVIASIIKKRELQGKETEVVLYGQRVPRKKIRKEISRNVKLTGTLARRLDDTPTPEGLAIITPTATTSNARRRALYINNLPFLLLWEGFSQMIQDILPLHADISPNMELASLRFLTHEHYHSNAEVSDGESQTVILSSILRQNIYESLRLERISPSLHCLPEHTFSPVPNVNNKVVSKLWGLTQSTRTLLFLTTNDLSSPQLTHSSLAPLLLTRPHKALAYLSQTKSHSVRILRQSILHGAVIAKDISVARLLVSEFHPVVSSRGDLVTTAFTAGDADMINILCAAGLKPIVSKYTPLDTPREHKEGLTALLTLLQYGAHPDCFVVNEKPGFPLRNAAVYGLVEAVISLLKGGAEIGFDDPASYGTALQAAIAHDQDRITDILLQCGANFQGPFSEEYKCSWYDCGNDPRELTVFERDISGLAPIQVAAMKNNLGIVKKLLLIGADPDACPVARPRRRRVEDHPINRQQADEALLTALQYAVKHRNINMVQLLLSCGADVDSGNGSTEGDTPLQIAARLGDEEIIRLLLQRGADISAPARAIDGRTAIQAAAENGNVSIARILIQASADVNISAAEILGMTAIQAASFHGHALMVGFLYAQGASVNAPPAQKGGLTALQAAAAGGHTTIIHSLLDLGADINAPGAEYAGWTAIQAGIWHQNRAMLQLLINHGADVNALPSASCGTPLQEASKVGWLEGVVYLLQHGADTNVPPNCLVGTGNNFTPLGWSIYNEDYAMMETLLKAGADTGCSPSSDFHLPSAILFALHHRKGYRWLLANANVYNISIKKTLAIQTAPAIAIRALCEESEVYKYFLEGLAYPPAKIHQERLQQAWNEIPVQKKDNIPYDEEELLKTMKLLLNAGSDIDQTCLRTKSTCLGRSIHMGLQKVSEFLLDQGAAFDTPATLDIGTPLQEAIVRGYPEMIDKFLDNEVDINSGPAYNGGTALQIAASKGMIGIVMRLLELGADVMAPAATGPRGCTAIDGAAANGRIDTVQLLLNVYEAELDENTETGVQDVCNRAAGFAEEKGHIAVAKWLREYTPAQWQSA